jgi:hydroxylamine reductase (hybrid-cluster protein)
MKRTEEGLHTIIEKALERAAGRRPPVHRHQRRDGSNDRFCTEHRLGVADKVIEGVKSGAIKRFFLVGGCDGARRQELLHGLR